MIIGNAVLVVKGERRFAGSLHQALTEFRKLSTDEKICATVNTEGKAYLGSEIAKLIAAVESVDWMGAGAASENAIKAHSQSRVGSFAVKH